MQTSSLKEAKATIEKETRLCVQKALLKGNQKIIANQIDETLDDVLKTLQEINLSEDQLKEMKSKLSAYCQSLREDYEQEYQKIINSESCKQVINFFTDEGLPEKAINILLSKGISTIAIVKQLSPDTELWNSVIQEFDNEQWSNIFEQSLSGCKIQSFVKSCNLNDLKKQGEEKILQRQQQTKEAIQEIDMLRQKVQDPLRDNRLEIEDGLQRVNSKLEIFNMNLNLPSIDRIEELKEQLNGYMTYLKKVKEDLEKKPLDLPTSELLQQNGVFHGFLLEPQGNVKEKEVVITLSPEVIHDEKKLDEFLQNWPVFDVRSRTFDSAVKFEQFQAWTKMGGCNWNIGVDALASECLQAASGGLGFTQENSSEESKQEARESSKFTYIDVRQIFYMKKKISIPRDKLRISEAALQALKTILKTTDDQRTLCLDDFFSTFGSHVITQCTLGGYYELRGKVNEVTNLTKNDVQKAVSKKLETNISAGLKFLSPGVGGSAASSFSLQNQNVEGNKSENSVEERVSEIESTIFAKGGNLHTSISLWMNSLEFNNSWSIIERDLDNAIPIWKLLRNDTSFSEREAQELAILLQSFWEQEQAKEKFQAELNESIFSNTVNERLQRMKNSERVKREFEDNWKGVKLYQDEENDICGLEYHFNTGVFSTKVWMKRFLEAIATNLKSLKSLNLEIEEWEPPYLRVGFSPYVGLSYLLNCSDVEFFVELLAANLKSLQNLKLVFICVSIPITRIRKCISQIGTNLKSLKSLELTFHEKSQFPFQLNLEILVLEKSDIKSLADQFGMKVDFLSNGLTITLKDSSWMFSEPTSQN